MRDIYQLKVLLKNSKPPIWRRILIPSDASFWELHIAIQDSFGWYDCHLHSFFIGETWGKDSIEIKIPHPDDHDFMTSDDRRPLYGAKVKLSEFLSEENPRCNYVYDYGDHWEHGVLLEKVLPYTDGEEYPQVIKGKRACPWEDSGSLHGYYDKLDIIKNKKHPDRRDILEWLDYVFGMDGNEYDPEYFDPSEVDFRDAKKALDELLSFWREEEKRLG